MLETMVVLHVTIKYKLKTIYMKLKINLYYVCCLTLVLIFCCSCKFAKNKEKHAYMLKITDDSISFTLDKDTRSSIMTMFTYSDNNNEYLTFQNPNKNQILFYNLKSGVLDFKIEPEIDGANGVAFILGYYIHNLDSIFLTTRSFEEISLINKDAILIDKFEYGKTVDGIELQRFYSTTAIYTPITIQNNNIYIVPGCNRFGEKNPVAASIDLKNKEVNHLPFEYPKFPGADNKNKRAGIEEHMSRCFDGEKFIYSFYFDENIYITDVNHKKINKIIAKSKYIDKVKYIDDYGRTSIEQGCEIPNYGNLIYDKYRNVYYRIAYPETTLEKGIKGYELREYGRKNFSIIILDKKFNVIGETLFPDYTYNSRLIFVREDGVYISNSHYLNPNFNDDTLGFNRFSLNEV